MYDYLIKNALIIDGTGAAGYKADVAVSDGKIVDLGSGNTAAAQRVIEANGKILAPGFIDLHSHSDLGLILSSFEPNKLSQGVTTEVGGNCGFSLFPVTAEGRPAVQQLMKAYGAEMEIPWSDGRGYYAALRQRGFGVNYLPLVGHGLLRLNVMGGSASAPDKSQLKAMESLLATELEAGAWGFSTGLAYMPGCFAGFEELKALAAVTARYGGVYTSHIRNQGNELLGSVEEAIGLAESTGVAVVISHLKAYGVSNWGKAGAALERIEAARSKGYKVMADFYPYDSSASTLMYEMPEWAKAGGVEALIRRLSDPQDKDRIRQEIEQRGELSWDRVVVSGVKSEAHAGLIGRSITQIAEDCGPDREPFDVVAELLKSEQGGVSTVCRLMSAADVDEIAVSGVTALGSDSYALPEGQPFTGHPRNWGAFPHFYDTYVKKKKLLKPEQAVYKMSGMAADFLGLSDRGKIKAGYTADLVLFDPENIAGPASFTAPDTPSSGIEMVLVNGVVQYEHKELQREPVGEILLKSREG
ncbi:MAG: N-acyl-D-amino-acid deacylase family protein [Spirochaetota bacterium]